MGNNLKNPHIFLDVGNKETEIFITQFNEDTAQVQFVFYLI